MKGIIVGGLTTNEFAMACQTDSHLSEEILSELIQNGIGRMENGTIHFEKSDRLKTALLAINRGAAIDEASQHLKWDDFESLAAEILEKRDFETSHNIILTKPRMQIDVVGIKFNVAVLIDCKHWKKMNHSSIENAVKKQIQRVKHFMSKEKVEYAIPAIVTLYQNRIKFIDKVPIIPIYQLDSFCDELYGNMDNLHSSIV